MIEGGSSVDEAIAAAKELAEREGKGFCHPYDDPAVVAGQGTLGLELVEDLDDLQLRHRPARRRRPRQRRGHRRQVADAPRPGRRRAGGRVLPLRRRHASPPGPVTTLADGIAVKQPGALTAPLVEQWVDDVVTVDRGRHRRRHGAADGPGQALRRGRRRRRRRRPAVRRRPPPVGGGHTCVVLSGGNVDLGVVPGLIRRHETTAGRRLVVFTKIDDRPGGLVKFLSVFAANGANLIDVEHHREGVNLSVRQTGVHATFEVRGADHAEAVVDAAAAAGFEVRRRDADASLAAGVYLAGRVARYLLVGRLSAWTTPRWCASSSRRGRALLERHLATSKEWFPHELIPYSRGRDAAPGEVWSEDDADLGGATIDDAVRSALIVNLLTEDNLPYYFRSIEPMFGADGAWGTWARRWTAEEGRHSMAIYGYLMTTRAVDPVDLERGRMAQVSGGLTPDPDSTADGFIYLTLQELATRIAHRNTGKLIGDPVGYA